METNKIRVVHYLNQFFSGLGGEEQADIPPRIVEGIKGPGQAIRNELGKRGEVVATAICGDNYIGEGTEEAAEKIVELIRPYKPDIVLAGPAFGAGRYGVACGAICQAVQKKLGIPAVAAMYRENPGLELYHKEVYIIETGNTVRSMSQAITGMVRLALKLADGEQPGKPSEDGYFPRGRVVNEEADRTGAERVVTMLLSKLKGEPFEPEVIQPHIYHVSPAPRLTELSSATVAMVTDGGLVPAGNPDGIETADATRFGKYDIKGKDSLEPEDYEVRHGGYDTVFIRQNPNRLVPLDIMREMEKQKVIGKLHDYFYSTTGVATQMENSRRMGREIARDLKETGVSAVILTST